MKISLHELPLKLQQNLAPVYLVAGDEYLLQEEACANIRNQAKNRGYQSTQRFTIEPGFNWQSFLSALYNRSLFSEKELLELDLMSPLQEQGTKALLQYLKAPPADKILIISSKKLDANTFKTAWYKALDRSGLIIQIWPLDPSQFTTWLVRYAKKLALELDASSLNAITELTFGNLLAAKQELEKLALLYRGHQITSQQILASLADNAHFDIFQLVAATCQGNSKLALQILGHLKNTGMEPPLIIWAYAKQLRLLIAVAHAMQHQQNLEQVCLQKKITGKQKNSIQRALQRLPLNILYEALGYLHQIDLSSKGVTAYATWEQLTTLCLQLLQGTINGQTIR